MVDRKQKGWTAPEDGFEFSFTGDHSQDQTVFHQTIHLPLPGAPLVFRFIRFVHLHSGWNSIVCTDFTSWFRNFDSGQRFALSRKPFFINVLTSSIFPVDRAYYFHGTSSSFHTELTRINATLVIRSGRCTDDIDFSIWITIVEFFIALLSTLRIFANLYVSSVVSNNLFVPLFRDKRCKSPLTYNVRNEVKHVGNSTDYNRRVTVCTKFCEASFSSYRC